MSLMRRGALFAGVLYVGLLFGPRLQPVPSHGGGASGLAPLPRRRRNDDDDVLIFMLL